MVNETREMDGGVSNPISFAGYPDAESYLELTNLVTPPPRTWSKSGIALVCVVACAGAGVISSIGIPLPLAILPVAFLVGVFPLMSWLGKRYMAKSFKRAYEKMIQLKPRTGSISAEGIYIKFTGGITEIQWTCFDQVVETVGAIGLFKKPELVEAFSRSMFDSDVAWNTVRQIVLAKIRVAA